MTAETPGVADATASWQRLQGAYAAAFKALERALIPLGSTLPQVQALVVVAHGPHPVTPSRLAAALALETQTVTGTVDRMEQRGWVERVRDLPDRRELRLQITDAGQSFLLEATAVMEQTLAQLFAGLAPAELELLSRLLARAYERALGPAPSEDPLLG